MNKTPSIPFNRSCLHQWTTEFISINAHTVQSISMPSSIFPPPTPSNTPHTPHFHPSPSFPPTTSPPLTPTTSPPIPSPSRLRRRPNSIRNLRLHLRSHSQQLLHNLITRLPPGLFDFLQLLFRFSISFFFGAFVAACVLLKANKYVLMHALPCLFMCVVVDNREGGGSIGGERTFFSNSLNSSSFFLRYSSISFWASVLASLTLLERSRRRGGVG